MIRFGAVTLTMVALLALALTVGGAWSGLALAYITLFTFLMDKIAALAAPEAPDSAEFPAADPLSVALALAQFPLLFGGIHVLSQTATGTTQKALIFVALSLFLGQVGNSNAHELIHRSNRWFHRLGVAVYCSVLFGHHASAHVRVHHIHAATDADPNSARHGESFWRFALRAWHGSFREGWRAEAALRKRSAKAGLHPYVTYALGALVSGALATAVAGLPGLLWLLALSSYAQAQLLLSDYVQHYGLRRTNRADGRPEPVGPAHSWNAPHWFSSALMLNAPRHSDHHAHPGRRYPALELHPASMPVLPYALPVMAVIALVPPLWRRVMDHRARKWAGTTQM
ncbi:alkane 1-monooxygenase [Mesobacterium sp. TK19101]|uniref:Alkane 1-monooxygenase n=1 Tax=Mesobacterium hydrothermale TaxID=3111907 RepID=A0ABU6HIG9_9RHOB|nr:alkane 1-monooxygenase [Mesobacterium sp. TK19101]MEC3862264.1 alkane 1-monooxygenase [Mesobacterium sp. TK19101]